MTNFELSDFYRLVKFYLPHLPVTFADEKDTGGTLAKKLLDQHSTFEPRDAIALAMSMLEKIRRTRSPVATTTHEHKYLRFGLYYLEWPRIQNLSFFF